MLRLMIVDDEQIIRETLSRVIDYQAIGYQLIGTAKNGMEAYDIICDEYPDVVITDIRMPILSGLDLIDRAMKADSNITFILLSGYSEFEYAKQAMQYGVRHYLLKPTDKQELIRTLTSIREERLLKQKQEEENRSRLLYDLHGPLEQCFVIESMEYPENLSDIFRKYQPLLSLPSSCTVACICSFVEEHGLRTFAGDVGRFLTGREISLCFPLLYVKNNVILIFSAWSLEFQETFEVFLDNLQYLDQSVSYVSRFLHTASTSELFCSLFLKLSRFEQISMLDSTGNSYEIHNNIASLKRIRQIGSHIAKACGDSQLFRILDSAFAEDVPLETARNLALGIFLELDSKQDHQPLDLLCDFFRKLYSCPDTGEVRKLMHAALLQKSRESPASKTGSNIALLKSYVEQHLDSEQLSLKWLAEHYLFVSVGYLSKQFVKEEGLRFSDYLNQKRMEEAERLMIFYHSDNIKSIARQVGFGNNPQYFSQVFKRYTGLTPTEYLEKSTQK